MAFVLKIRRMDIRTGNDTRIVVLRGHDASAFGINPGDRLRIRFGRVSLNVVADITHQSIRHGEIGLFDEVWHLLRARNGQPLTIELVSRPTSVAAIKKKLLGQPISRTEIRSIMNDIASHNIGSVETTYFVASGYVRPYSLRELIWMVEAMAESGETFSWPGRWVVDKHSVGGLAGNRTTLVTVPIIAAWGLTIPKTSSRAITSPAGTADTMEVLAPVSFSGQAVRRIVTATNGCLIWGGGLSIAPVDDIIIRVSRPMSLEPYDKMIVSIMAKKVAMGIRYLVIDLPYGPETKIPDRRMAEMIKRKFLAVGRAFRMRVKVRFDIARQPVGHGIGPALEARDVLRVLQQKTIRPKDLELKAIDLSAELVALTGLASYRQARQRCDQILRSGQAWRSMQSIIRAQGGSPDIDANDVALGAQTWRVWATRSGVITGVNNRSMDEVARTLGAPERKLAGIYLHRKLGQRVRRGDKLYTLYSYSRERITLARIALGTHPLVHIR
ncbi:MAG: thymidine phosphorylase [Candidatus Kerfeldbacteria bacterium]|nr:thymidine phosphorylase [Candidatus Kerfeldbacteria bacterium]